MDFVALLCLLLILYGGKVKFKDFHVDYLCREQTNAVKGIFILFVFFRHFTSYIKEWGVHDLRILNFNYYLDQFIVVMFLFYSGYGVAKAIESKGWKYVIHMPVKRILSVWLRFAAAVLLFLLLRISMGKKTPVGKVFKALVGWESLGNSNWYMFVIIVLYIITFLAALICHANKHVTWMLSLCGSMGLMYVLFLYKDNFWYNTLIAYSFGMIYAVYQKQFEKVLLKNRFYIPAFVVTYLLCTYAKDRSDRLFYYEVAVVLFVMLLLLVSMKLSLRNKVLQYMGRHLFSLYMLQRLPMIALKKTAVYQNMYVYFFVCVIITFVLSWIFDLFSSAEFYQKLKYRTAESR